MCLFFSILKWKEILSINLSRLPLHILNSCQVFSFGHCSDNNNSKLHKTKGVLKNET